MNSPVFPASAPADLRELNGRNVLVKSAPDRQNPPIAMRGWLEVSESGTTPPAVGVAVEFPQMFRTSAHHRTFLLDEPALARLLATERDGIFEFTIDEELV